VDSQPTGRRSDLVHARLRADVLEGRLAPGEAVPSERALAEELGVNRHAVREALKRLEQAGLVRITQGGATRVQDWRESAGLEVLLDLVASPDGPPPELARAVLEMRESIGVDAARRCAARADDAQRAQVAALAEDAAAAIEAARAVRSGSASGAGADPDPSAVDGTVDEAYAVLWRAVVGGAQNLAYQLALTSLVGALDAHPEVAAVTRPEDAAGVRALGAAVARGAVDEAGAVARRLLEPDARAFD
jgi:GntR family transcriptional repressor for pyruvate dehydrogenase complex